MPDEVKPLTAEEIAVLRRIAGIFLVSGKPTIEDRLVATIDARDAEITLLRNRVEAAEAPRDVALVRAMRLAENAAYRECAGLVCYHCRMKVPFERTNWHRYADTGLTQFCTAAGIREAYPEAFRP
jgi:hypothetical protein